MKNQNILFSIITPTYNRGDMISIAIESVLNQSYDNWELIIIDDGSTDNTREIVKKYRDIRIKYYYQENKGKSSARNKGLDNSTGDYISFLDDDDYYLPEFLSAFHKTINQTSDPDVLYMCDAAEEQGDGNIFHIKKDLKGFDNPALYLWKNSTNYMPFVTPKSAFENNRFDIRFPLGQDFHLLIRIATELRLIHIPKVLCVIRNHRSRSVRKEYGEQFITNGINRIDYLEDLLHYHLKDLNKYIPLRLLNDKYNKISYFYASTAMKKGYIRYVLKLMKAIKWGGTFYKVLYYKLSVLVRLPVYAVLSLTINKNSKR